MAKKSPGLQAAIDELGLQGIADLFGIKRQSVNSWRKVPPDRCQTISTATGIPLHVLRPDCFFPPA